MRKLIRLPFINALEANLLAESGWLQVILGPRQVGKTTSVLNYLEAHQSSPFLYQSADKVFNATTAWIKEQWLIARQEKKLLVIDEIQKIENWAEAIKSLWDEDKRAKKWRVQCVLLGSSSLDIHQGLTESLAGRYQLIRAHHWNYGESKRGYGLSFPEYLKFGGYPGTYPLIGRPQEWSEYIRHSILEAIIEKDILVNRRIRSPSLFKQAFEIICSYPAQELSYTKLLGQLQERGNTDLVKHYVQLLEGAYLIRALEKYSGSAVRVRSSSPKFLPLAPAIFFQTVLEEYKPETYGRVFELLVGTQLVRTGLDLYYWRENNFEVDYVVKRGRRLWAIEVKSGRKRDFVGLEKFKKSYPSAEPVLIDSDNYGEFETDPVSFLEKA